MNTLKVVVPAIYSDTYGKDMCITRGLDRTLSIYFKDNFNEMSEKIKELSTAEPEAVRFVLSGVEETRISEVGELLLPDFFIDYMGGEGEWMFTRFGDGIRLHRNS